MKRWAMIDANTVTFVTEQEDQPTISGVWVECPPDVGPKWTYDGAEFHAAPTPPAPAIPKIITKVAFRFRLTDAEYTAILEAADADYAVKAWVETFNMVSQVNLADERTVTGLNVLVSKELLTQERATEILSATVLEGERP